MTRRLVLVRHAKAGLGNIDHERPLAGRGRSDAAHLGQWLADQGVEPERVLVSTALRTRQTWAAMAAAFPTVPDAEFDRRLYGNSLEDLLGGLRDTPDSVCTLVVVGHNPSVQALALYLDDQSGADELSRRVTGKFPTSAVAIIDIEGAWNGLGLGAGPLIAYADPSTF